MKKKLFAMLLAASMAAALLVGCGSSGSGTSDDTSADTEQSAANQEDTASSGYKMAFTCKTMDNEFFSKVSSGAEEFCEENGIEYLFEGADYDAATQVTQFENYISAGYNAIIFVPVDESSLTDVIAEAREAGIVVICHSQKVDGCDGYCLVDDYDYGEVMGQAAADWINKYLADEEEVKFALICEDEVESCIPRGDAMYDVITEQCPNAVFVDRQSAESSEEAQKVAETYLTANPDIQVIACVNDQMAIGASNAVDAMGLYSDTFYIGGGDYTDAIVDYLADTESAVRCSVDIQGKQTGYDAAKMAYDILEGTGEGYEYYFEFKPMYQEGTL